MHRLKRIKAYVSYATSLTTLCSRLFTLSHCLSTIVNGHKSSTSLCLSAFSSFRWCPSYHPCRLCVIFIKRGLAVAINHTHPTFIMHQSVATLATSAYHLTNEHEIHPSVPLPNIRWFIRYVYKSGTQPPHLFVRVIALQDTWWFWCCSPV